MKISRIRKLILFAMDHCKPTGKEFLEEALKLIRAEKEKQVLWSYKSHQRRLDKPEIKKILLEAKEEEEGEEEINEEENILSN